ncbi:hypothetical protein Ddc_18479 [Ditylenchus destructor]|nr:hypothetical protein Ddc_18479 [Ditylenchus destructor]
MSFSSILITIVLLSNALILLKAAPKGGGHGGGGGKSSGGRTGGSGGTSGRGGGSGRGPIITGSGHGSGRSTGICGGSYCPVIVTGTSSSAPTFYNLNFIAKAAVHLLNATHTYQISFKASNPGVFGDHTFGTAEIQPAQVQSTASLNGTAKFYEPFSYRTKVEMLIDGNSVASDYCNYICQVGGCDCTTDFNYNESELQNSAALHTLKVPLPFVFVHDALVAVQSLGETALNALDSSLNGLD